MRENTARGTGHQRRRPPLAAVLLAAAVCAALPYISEFSPSGALLFNAQFPHAVSTYRAYRLPWPPVDYQSLIER